MPFSISAIPHVIIMWAEFFTGITVNGFLVIISCHELIKSRKLTPMQLLLTSIGVSRFGLQMVLMVQSFFSVFFPLLYQEKIHGATLMFLWMFFNSTSLWFATCLSLFYCCKLIGFTQSCFLWLKFRIPKLMPWLLSGSLLASMGTAALCVEGDYPQNTEDGVLRNVTRTGYKLKLKHTDEVLLVNLALIFPLAVFVVCTCLLLVSLCKHARRMQDGSRGFGGVSTEVHINALRMVLTFFLFFISYFGAFMANLTFTFPYKMKHFVVKDIMGAYPSGHSVVIILSNSKFQKQFRRLLCLKKN